MNMIFSKNCSIGQGSSSDSEQKIQTREMFSKKRRNAIKRHKQNLEQVKDLTDNEQKIEDQ